MLDLTVVPRSTATPLHACYFLITVLKMGKPKPQTLAEDFTKKIMRAPKETLRLVIGIMSPGYAQSCPGCRAPLTGSTPLPTPRPLSPKMVCMGRSPPPHPPPTLAPRRRPRRLYIQALLTGIKAARPPQRHPWPGICSSFESGFEMTMTESTGKCKSRSLMAGARLGFE